MWRYDYLFNLIDFDALPDGAGQEPVSLRAADGAISTLRAYFRV